MVLTDTEVLVRIVIISGLTFLLRVLPFLLFPAGKPTPNYIVYLGKVLPYAIIGMLVIYCLKDVLPSVTTIPFGAPEFLSIFLTILLHVWKRNSLLSIGGGTLLYMILVQTIFA